MRQRRWTEQKPDNKSQRRRDGNPRPSLPPRGFHATPSKPPLGFTCLTDQIAR